MLLRKINKKSSTIRPNKYLEKRNFWETALERISADIENHKKLKEEILIAKQKYFIETGPIHENDEDFSNRMNSFLFWFLFDWTYGHEAITPFQTFLSLDWENTDSDWIDLTSKMENHLYSIFELTKINSKETIVRDLFTKKKYRLPECHSLMTLEKGSFFESRLFFLENCGYFANYFILHPYEVRKKILNQINLIRNTPKNWKKMILRLHSFHTKWSKYRNIKIQYIYHFDKNDPKAK